MRLRFHGVTTPAKGFWCLGKSWEPMHYIFIFYASLFNSLYFSYMYNTIYYLCMSFSLNLRGYPSSISQWVPGFCFSITKSSWIFFLFFYVFTQFSASFINLCSVRIMNWPVSVCFVFVCLTAAFLFVASVCISCFILHIAMYLIDDIFQEMLSDICLKSCL